jgi:hypothetical protein
VKNRCAAIVLTLVVCSCGGGSPTAPSTPAPPSTGISAAAQAYLDQLVNVMQANSINRQTIDWASFRQSVVAAAGSAQTIANLSPAISTALGLLGDHHSYFIRPDGSYILNPTSPGCSLDPAAPTPTVPADIGYVKVGAISGSVEEKQRYAIAMQDAIRAADSTALSGWIVDVRGNSGGSMWPMLAGIGPVLGEGTLGFFVDPNGKTVSWEYRAGMSLLDGQAVTTVPSPYTPLRPGARVAVLTDRRVASSGEATVIAFRGRPNTRSFGAATCGLSTANGGFTMSDGAQLVLANAVMADRTGNRYGVPVPPDEFITDPAEAVQRAIQWLRGSM